MAESDKALETWMRGSLADSFGPVADECLPDEWLRIVDGAVAD